MDLNSQINLEHLLFVDRQCRVCKKYKSLLVDFYLTRKDRGSFPSSYSYECKSCTISRIKNSRKRNIVDNGDYPDW